MPWTQNSAMEMRIQFIADYQRGLFSFAELCRRYGISRKTGYKWIDRFEREGSGGLMDRSHRTKHCPHATTPRSGWRSASRDNSRPARKTILWRSRC